MKILSKYALKKMSVEDLRKMYVELSGQKNSEFQSSPSTKKGLIEDIKDLIDTKNTSRRTVTTKPGTSPNAKQAPLSAREVNEWLRSLPPTPPA